MKKIIFTILAFIAALTMGATTAFASILPVNQGGTGVNTITGIIKGNGTAPFSVATPGVDYLQYVSVDGTTITGDGNTIPLSANSGSGLSALTANQVAFGDPFNIMTSSSDLVYDPSSLFFRAGFSGKAVLNLDRGNGLYQAGDLGGALHSTYLSLWDANYTAGLNTNSPDAAWQVLSKRPYTFTDLYSGSLPTSWTSSFVGPATSRNSNATLTLQSVDIAVSSLPPGYFLGTTLIGATSGSLGTITNIVGGIVTVHYTSVGNHFLVGESVSDGFLPPFTVLALVNDYFSWSQGGGPSSPEIQVNSGFVNPIGDANQFNFVFLMSSGYDAGDTWTLSYVEPGAIERLDSTDGTARFTVYNSGAIQANDLSTNGLTFQADMETALYGLGDIGNVENGTSIVMNDTTKRTTITADDSLWVVSTLGQLTLEVRPTSNTVTISNAYTLPNFDAPFTNYVMTSDAAGTAYWVDANSLTTTTHLAPTYVGFGDAGGFLTGDGSMSYDVGAGRFAVPIVNTSQIESQSTGLLAIDVDQMNLYYPGTGNVEFDGTNGQLYDPTAVKSVLFGTRRLIDSVANASVDWGSTGGLVTIGDITSSVNGSILTVNDPGNQLVFENAAHPYLNVDVGSGRVQLGDIDSVSNPCWIDFRPVFNNTILHSCQQFVVQNGSNIMMDLDQQFGFYVIGDYSGVANTTTVYISDSNQEISLNSGGSNLLKTSLLATEMNFAIASQNMTVVTSGSPTIGSAVRGIYYDPASLVAAATITLPATPVDGQEVLISFGGTIASGATVVTLLTIAPNTGQTTEGALPTTAVGGQSIGWKYRAGNTKWYRMY